MNQPCCARDDIHLYPAMAGRDLEAGWEVYVRWLTWAWYGEVERVIAELAARQSELGRPEKEEPITSPRQIVAEALTYLQNQQSRIRYDECRREGLPITSCYIESTVKQMNARVKGTEKFWSPHGGEALLQLRADYLSDNDSMLQILVPPPTPTNRPSPHKNKN